MLCLSLFALFSCWFVDWTDRADNRLTDRLTQWPTDWPKDWPTALMTDRCDWPIMTDRAIDWPTNPRKNQLTQGPTDWTNDSSTDPVIDRQTDWPTNSLTDRSTICVYYVSVRAIYLPAAVRRTVLSLSLYLTSWPVTTTVGPTDRLTQWLTNQPSDIDWPNYQPIDWTTDWSNKWPTEHTTNQTDYRLNKWPIDWTNDWCVNAYNVCVAWVW